MKVGQYAVIWSPMFRRPAVKRRAAKIIALGKRIKVQDDHGFRLLAPSDILAIFDDQERADALARQLAERGENYFRAEREALAKEMDTIVNLALEASRRT